MSRCFPFPPRGYVRNGMSEEALIESIKRADEKAKKEQRRKERKREKNDKEKKEKKDKKRKEREGESEKHSRKRRRKEEGVKDGLNNQKVDAFHKLKESGNSCLEKSSLTVERELLQSTSQNSCDSTLNSNEKEKQPLVSRHNNNDSESIIRIRLPVLRPKEHEVMMMTNKDQQETCPSREIKLDTVQSVTRKQPQHPCSTSVPEHASKPQQPCSTSAPEHALKPHKEKRKDHTSRTKLRKEKKLPFTKETSQPSNGLCRFCPPSMAKEFLNVENWVPSRIESIVELTNSEDDECWWLTKKTSSHKFDTERCKQLDRNNESKQVIRSSIVWPCARLLPEVDVHALPYTVPF